MSSGHTKPARQSQCLGVAFSVPSLGWGGLGPHRMAEAVWVESRHHAWSIPKSGLVVGVYVLLLFIPVGAPHGRGLSRSSRVCLRDGCCGSVLVNAGLQGRHLGKGLYGCIPLYLDWDASSKKFFKTEPAISIQA